MIFLPHTFQLLIAPPAWGKTRLFMEWVSEDSERFVFISPLRALASEVKSKCPEAWVVLPEEIASMDWEGLARTKPNTVVIWDEVHLVSEWGLTFRHALLESWYGFCLSGLAGVGFTATSTDHTRQFLEETLAENHQFLLTGDAGNFQFRHSPSKYVWAPRHWLHELLLTRLAGRTLVFCHHRFEVDEWCRVLSQNGIHAWGCKGGETRHFSERLQNEKWPDVIVATSCLSHGVNLPELRRVVLLDSEADFWMAHQMRTRAGRRGETFEVWGSWKTRGIPLCRRPVALLRGGGRVMMSRVRIHLRAWWYGP